MQRWQMEDHVVVLVGLAAGSYVALRVIAVAGWNFETAYVLLQTQGTASVILGSLLPLGGFIAILLSMSFLLTAFFAKVDERPNLVMIAGSAAIAAYVIGFAMMPIGPALVVIPYTAFMAILLFHLDRRWKPDQPPPKLIKAVKQSEEEHPNAPRIVWGLALAIAALMALTSARPWLPREEFSADAHFVGWLLAQDDQQMVVLLDDPRMAVQLPASTRHNFCTKTPDPWRPWWRILTSGEPIMAALRDSGDAPRCGDAEPANLPSPSTRRTQSVKAP